MTASIAFPTITDRHALRRVDVGTADSLLTTSLLDDRPGARLPQRVSGFQRRSTARAWSRERGALDTHSTVPYTGRFRLDA